MLRRGARARVVSLKIWGNISRWDSIGPYWSHYTNIHTKLVHVIDTVFICNSVILFGESFRPKRGANIHSHGRYLQGSQRWKVGIRIPIRQRVTARKFNRWDTGRLLTIVVLSFLGYLAYFIGSSWGATQKGPLNVKQIKAAFQAATKCNCWWKKSWNPKQPPFGWKNKHL